MYCFTKESHLVNESQGDNKMNGINTSCHFYIRSQLILPDASHNILTECWSVF